MATNQLGLFDLGPEQPVKLPSTAKPSKVAVRYADYSTRTFKCADCEQFVYEELMAGRACGHQVRLAKVKRTADAEVTLLCREHARARQEIEANQPKRRRKAG